MVASLALRSGEYQRDKPIAVCRHCADLGHYLVCHQVPAWSGARELVCSMAMKVAGGLYLAWTGIKMIQNSFGTMGPLDISSEGKAKTKSIEYSMRAMLISYSNPKSILFLSAVFPSFLDNSSPIAPQFAVMFLTIVTIVMSIHGTYAFIALRMRDGLVGVRARKIMARFSGASFLGFGLAFVYDAQR